MKIISWNVNGLKSIIKKGFKSKINKMDADVICIQEIKTRVAIKGFSLEGYYSYYNYSSISGYSGVATFTRKKPNNVIWGININENNQNDNVDDEARVLTLEFNDFYIVNVYVPHPQTKNARKEYRERFNKNFNKFINNLGKSVIICGDFNICHKNIDIYNLKVSKKQKNFLLEQRESFDDLLKIGLIDSFRYMHPQMRKYTLKSNKIQELDNSNFGWRLDYILISENMKKEIRQANILNEIEGSDHCPVELVLRLSNGNDSIFNGEKVLYIPKGYIKNKELENIRYVKRSFDNDILGDIWQSYNFDKAEEKVFNMQCKLSKAVFNHNNKKRIKIQKEIACSTEAKMLSIRKVAEKSKTSAGIDGVLWEKASDKMRAAISLNNGTYKSSPLRQYVFHDSKCAKERKVGIPTIYDRAMQVLYSYTLEPVAEATADRKSFAFRKGKSPELMHSFIMKIFEEKNPPEWFLISDIKSYYNSISHKWLIEHLPMDKQVLREFLKSKYIFNGELFNTEAGISLGCNISTIIGNMTLDGLQKALYDLQGKEIKDYYNGQCLRFADDVLITARTKEDALALKKQLKKFISKRGLKLSENKTRIVNIREGFVFLSRYYCKINGVVRCIPAEKAVEKYKKEMEALIFNNYERWSLTKLIDNINSKISGFATYHKVEEATETFIHLDVITNALLLKMLKKIHPTYSNKQLIKKYWVEDSLGRQIFTTPDKRKKYVKNMADTILISEKVIDLKKNIFLDRNYFKDIEKNRDIQNCIGRYKRVYDRQEGKCFFCSKTINKTDEKKIIYKKHSKDKTIRNMAYIHADCENQILTNINIDSDIGESFTVRQLLKEITNENHINRKESKFKKLAEFFYNTRKKKVKLTFNAIEKILDFKLCSSAYKYKSYFFNKKSGMISRAWLDQGFKIENIDIKKQIIEFKRVQFKRRINIPAAIYRLNLPDDAIDEANSFFMHFVEKYRLK